MKLLKKIFFFENKLKNYQKILKVINSHEDSLMSLSDLEIQEKASLIKDIFKIFLSKVEDINDLKDKKNRKHKEYVLLQEKFLPEIFAIVREASKRSLNLRHFDSQIIGGLTLNDGCIAEMKTGEGKTLVATLPACFNAIIGKNVHIVTVNDYLAERDCNWMKPLYDFLNLSSGFVIGKKNEKERLTEYAKNIVHVTNTEIGFDYLKDNMKNDLSDMVLINKSFDFAIVDEVDSILIDEARTPLIISGENVGDLKLYSKINKLVNKLEKEDFEVDEKTRSVHLTDSGSIKIEQMLKNYGILKKEEELYGLNSSYILNHILQALKAEILFKEGKDYIILNKKVCIVDEFTGRVMDGRRYSEGLHQAIEAKEDLEVQQENVSLASITYQNFFRLYDKLSGMTGTAATEAREFLDIYNLEVVSIPTNKKVIRKDLNDLVYVKEEFKLKAIVERVKKAHEQGQPVLIGTVSIEKSEKIASVLKKEKFDFNILNAKNHEKEANIIAQAGKFKAITIATNMAGRGTDIKLGGNLERHLLTIEEDFSLGNLSLEEKNNLLDSAKREYEIEKQKVIDSGGLLVIGTERHENRRIDNQLKGRSGRQGDPGETQFFISLEDDLIRIFGGEKIKNILSLLGMKDDEIMNHSMIDGVIARSQKKIEKMHYEARKNIKQYDDIENVQRKNVYEQRKSFLQSLNPFAIIKEMLSDEIDILLDENRMYLHSTIQEEKESIYKDIHFLSKISLEEIKNSLQVTDEPDIRLFLQNTLNEKYKFFPPEVLNSIAREVLLTTFDENWRLHLADLDHLKESIHLRAFGQKNPIVEYQTESFVLFEKMIKNSVRQSVLRMFKIEIDV